MKKIQKLAIILIILTSILSCESNNKDLLNVKIVDKDGLNALTYLPNLEFSETIDSAKHLLNEQDFRRLLTSEIKVAQPIFQNDIFKVRVFTRSNYRNNINEHGFLVRTYSKDGKIKDEIVLASTLGGLSCEGRVTSDLKIVTNCPKGEKIVAQIEYDGNIKIIENE